MKRTSFGVQSLPVTRATRWRHRFTLLTAFTTVALVAWGGFVTSINAGLAVPDWPSSFDSYDPFNPWPAWWTITPVLAEHGHRLLGALVGAFTVVLALWTWRADPRAWMRRLGFVTLALVILQGVLGGLRVVWVSLDLAVVHACVAQIFFSTIVAMALFTSPAWLRGVDRLPAGAASTRLRRRGLIAVAALYGQIILGALLRHPGTGIDPALVAAHLAGALIVFSVLLATALPAFFFARSQPLVRRAAGIVVGGLVLQVALGLTAYLVTIDDAGMLEPSNVQVVVNTAHLILGALLMAATVAFALLVLRGTAAPPETVQPAMPHSEPAAAPVAS